MLYRILDAAAQLTPMPAAALKAGRWSSDGPQGDRIGPYLRRVVSSAPRAQPDDIATVLGFARDSAPAVARLSPATRAGILQRAAGLAREHRDALARVLALELGKPVTDGGGSTDPPSLTRSSNRCADTVTSSWAGSVNATGLSATTSNGGPDHTPSTCPPACSRTAARLSSPTRRSRYCARPSRS